MQSAIVSCKSQSEGSGGNVNRSWQARKNSENQGANNGRRKDQSKDRQRGEFNDRQEGGG